jgi:hypothetical protein
MTEVENIDRVVTALLKVPEKKLLIIEIANSIPIVHTMQAVNSLVRLRAIKEA